MLGSRLSSDPALRDAVGLPAPSDPNATLPGKQSVVDIPIKLIAEGARLEDLLPIEARVRRAHHPLYVERDPVVLRLVGDHRKAQNSDLIVEPGLGVAGTEAELPRTGQPRAS